MSNVTTDHDEIRKWAESKGGVPAAVDRTHKDGDVGIVRLMFPKNPQSEHGSLVEISWDEFFKQFEEAQLALIYDDKSLFSKLVGRDTVEKRAHGDGHAARHEDRGSSAKASGKGASSGGKNKDEEASLKQREYRDADGTVHHHTKSYMEKHR